MLAVLYRDLPKYNDRRRNLWLPEVVHEHHGGLQRTMSNPSLYDHSEPSLRHAAAVDDSLVLYNGSAGRGKRTQRHRVNSVLSASLSNSTASFQSKHYALSVFLPRDADLSAICLSGALAL